MVSSISPPGLRQEWSSGSRLLAAVGLLRDCSTWLVQKEEEEEVEEGWRRRRMEKEERKMEKEEKK